MVCENTLWSQGKLWKWQQSPVTMLLKRRTLSLRSHTKPLTPFLTSLKPSRPIAPAEETMTTKETTKAEVKVLIQPTQEATTDASAPQDPTITWSSFHFLYLYISINNSIFWCLIFWNWMYYWWCIIYRHHFLFKLGIFLFPLLTNSFVFFETCGFSYTTQTPCH